MKSLWQALFNNGLWSQIIGGKYFGGQPVHCWIRRFDSSFVHGSMVWRILFKAFHIMERRLVWKLSNGKYVRGGRDGIVGLMERPFLSDEILN